MAPRAILSLLSKVSDVTVEMSPGSQTQTRFGAIRLGNAKGSEVGCQEPGENGACPFPKDLCRVEVMCWKSKSSKDLQFCTCELGPVVQNDLVRAAKAISSNLEM
ncbi:hypothetical protein CRENBAI_018190 [Crenichthys baileyi]|uniref:Uncharacterized protein n=1 Tax=Crenichthys baileyi TaxID=28760 RepID=A0AAV9QQQ3_9TELE